MGRAIAYGLAGGGVVVAAMFIVYQQSRAAFLSPLFQWSLALVYLVFLVLVLLRRPPYERFAALRVAFVTYLLISASYYVYSYALYELFDPELYRLQSELMIANAREHGLGTPGVAADAPEVLYAPENLRQRPGAMLLAYAQGALFGFALCYLLAQVLGRKVRSEQAA